MIKYILALKKNPPQFYIFKNKTNFLKITNSYFKAFLIMDLIIFQ